MDFGKYAVINDVAYRLEKEPDWFWEFKPPTAEEEIILNRFTAGGSVVTNLKGIERQVRSTPEIALQELALTFGETNIPKDPEKPVSEGGEPILKPGMTLEAKKAIINTFPSAMFYELWRALGEACPGWGAAPMEEEEEDDPKDISPPETKPQED